MNAKERAKLERKKEVTDREYLVAWTFQYKIAKEQALRIGLLKKKESVNVTPYWAVLVANFFLLFKPKKPEPDDDAYFAKFYGLMDDIDVSKIEPLTKGPPGFSMVVKAKKGDKREKQLQFACESTDVAIEWMQKIKKQHDTLRPMWEELKAAGGAALMEKMVQDLPRGLKADPVLRPDQCDRFIQFMQTYFDRFRKYRPLAHKMKFFTEYYNYNSQEYINWLLGSGKVVSTLDTCERMLLTQESKVVDEWRKKVTKTCADVEKAFEQRFFREDLEPIIKAANEAIQWAYYVNKYNFTIHPDMHEEEELRKEVLTMKAYCTLFSKLPHAKELTLEVVSGGKLGKGGMDEVKGSKQKWVWDVDDEWHEGLGPLRYKARCTTHTNLPDWKATNGYEFRSAWYGSVLWNRISWVWFHPKIRFVIRYNWRVHDRVFEFYPPKGEMKRGECLLPDWKWEKNHLVPIRAGKGEKMEHMVEWKVTGAVPLPVILTLALTRHLQETVGTVLHFEAPELQRAEEEAVYYTPFIV